MSEFESFQSELTPFERALAGLTPAASRIDRDRLMIELGRGLEKRRRRFRQPWAIATAALVLLCGVLSWQLVRVNALEDAQLAAARRERVEPASPASEPEASRALAGSRQDFIESPNTSTGFRRLLTWRDIARLTSSDASSASGLTIAPFHDHSGGPERPQPRGDRPGLRARDRAAWNKLLEAQEPTSPQQSNKKELGA